MKILLTGDVMLGRGIDQVLPYPAPPDIYERYVLSAPGYVALAERRNGPIAYPVPFSYVWGDMLEALRTEAPDVRIINLETAITLSERHEPKGINYRMNPANVPSLAAANIDCCVLANNHVLDWGPEGLVETLASLHAAGIATAGAGLDLDQARAPARLPIEGKGRILVYAFGCPSSGIPPHWSAAPGVPGVNLLTSRSEAEAARIGEQIAADRLAGDIVVASIHWGPNWGHAIPDADQAFAHHLIDRAGVDIVHGHSSHHPKAVELYRGRPIFHGCGDLINDYEGISGHEAYRPDLKFIYFVDMEPERAGVSVTLLPFRMVRFRLERALPADAAWLAARLDGQCLACGVHLEKDGRMTLAER